MMHDSVYLEKYNELKDKLPRIPSGNHQRSPYFDCYFYHDGNSIGVAVRTETPLEISHINPLQKLNMRAQSGLPGGVTGDFLTLSVKADDFANQNEQTQSLFIDIFLLFADKEGRSDLLKDPKGWAKNIIETFGNESSTARPYPYIAELYLLRELYANGLIDDIEKAYRGPEKDVHDFETPTCSFEVKSHLHGNRNDSPDEITISSDLQLKRTKLLNGDEKPLYLVYFHMAQEGGDISLKSVIDSFGNEQAKALEKLEKLDTFHKGDLYWEERYNILEALVFPVGDDFPRITPDKFVGGSKPKGVDKLIYSVNLRTQPCCTLKDFIDARKAGREPDYNAKTPEK